MVSRVQKHQVLKHNQKQLLAYSKKQNKKGMVSVLTNMDQI